LFLAAEESRKEAHGTRPPLICSFGSLSPRFRSVAAQWARPPSRAKRNPFSELWVPHRGGGILQPSRLPAAHHPKGAQFGVFGALHRQARFQVLPHELQ